MLLVGDSGVGKTGALASLAKAGYALRILDFDNGCDILFNALRSHPAAMDLIEYETLTDKLKSVNGMAMPDGIPTAFKQGIDLLDKWKMKERKGPDGGIIPAYDLGVPATWGTKTIVVIDSLTHMSNAALRYVKSTMPSKDGRNDIYNAQQMLEGTLALLYSSAFQCNVIVLSHISYSGEEGQEIGYPMSLGKALNPKVPSYFNTVLHVRVSGTGSGAKREILTQPEGNVALKTPFPSGLPRKFPIETGLADYFEALRKPL